MAEPRKALVLAGGRGTRMARAHPATPKPLVPVCGIPLLVIHLRRLLAAGYGEIHLALRHRAGEIIRFLREESGLPGKKLFFHVEEEPLGTGGALAWFRSSAGPVLALNGDLLSAIDYGAMEAFHEKRGADLTIAHHAERRRLKLGEVILDTEDRILEYREKPLKEYRISSGTYLVGKKVLELLGEEEWTPFPEVVERSLQAGLKVLGFAHSSPWIDVNDARDLARAEEMLREDPVAFGLEPREVKA